MSENEKFSEPHPLLSDGWSMGDEELSTVHSHRIADITRAADAVKIIARMVHNSLGEPECSGAQPLSRGTELGLLDALYCLGDYIFDNTEGMRETASALHRIDRERANA